MEVRSFFLVWLTICPIVSISLFQKKACYSDINAVIQHIEYPRIALLIIGSSFWEFDTVTGHLSSTEYSVQQYFYKAPDSPDSAQHLNYPPSNYHGVTFVKNGLIHFYICKKTLLACAKHDILNVDIVWVPLKQYSLEAGFSYQFGMPQRASRDLNKPVYQIHIFAKEDNREFDCWIVSAENKSGCDMSNLNENQFPYFYKLRPLKSNQEPILGAEIFYDRDLNQTDFLLVGSQYINYTVDGVPKFRLKADVFGCSLKRLWIPMGALLTGIGLIILVALLLVATSGTEQGPSEFITKTYKRSVPKTPSAATSE